MFHVSHFHRVLPVGFFVLLRVRVGGGGVTVGGGDDDDGCACVCGGGTVGGGGGGGGFRLLPPPRDVYNSTPPHLTRLDASVSSLTTNVSPCNTARPCVPRFES